MMWVMENIDLNYKDHKILSTKMTKMKLLSVLKVI